MARPSMGFDTNLDVVCDALLWDLCPSPSPLSGRTDGRRGPSALCTPLAYFGETCQFPRRLSPRTREARIQDVAGTNVTMACQSMGFDRNPNGI